MSLIQIITQINYVPLTTRGYIVKDLHQGKKSYTPYQYKKLLEDSSTKNDYG